MDRVVLLIVLLISCNTPPRAYLGLPPKTDGVIQELQTSKEVTLDLKNRVLQTLSDCSAYSKDAYDSFIGASKDIEALKADKIKLEKEIADLISEITPWRWIKRFFYVACAVMLGFYLLRLYLKIKPI